MVKNNQPKMSGQEIDRANWPITIAVSGKGGIGKTTIAGLIIELLTKKYGGPTLAVDADANANLNTILGIEVEKTIGQLEQEVLKGINDIPAGMTKKAWIDYHLQQILVEGKGRDLLVMGRGEGPDCYCAINHILRGFLDSLSKNYQFVVIDNEAGMEHISRRTTYDVDVLLMISDGNPVAIQAAKRIDQLVDELEVQVKRRYLLLNNLRNSLPPKAKQEIEDSGLDLVGRVPHDEKLLDLCWKGESLDSLNSDSTAKTEVKKALKKIIPL